MGSISSRRHSVERPSSRKARRWLGTRSDVRVNQKPESPVSTRPLSGISVGRTTSKVEMRSLATSSNRSESSSKISRTLPLATWTAVSGMNGFLLAGHEGGQSVEDDVDVLEGVVQLEGGIERLRGQRHLGVLLQQRAKVESLVPRAERVALDESVRLVAGEAGLDEREQDALAEHEAVRRVEVGAHPGRIDDEAVGEPGEPVEHVIEAEEGIGEHDAFGARVRDIPLVPERDVLESHRRRRSQDAREAAEALRDDGIPFVRHRGRAFLPAAERLLNLTDLGAREVADL